MIRNHSLSGEPYTMVRKVRWDECWHACWETNINGKKVLNWDRYDKETALEIAENLANINYSLDISIAI